MDSPGMRRFEPWWVIVGYLMTLGGVTFLVAIQLGLGLKGEVAACVFFTLGTALGGFFSGRARPDRSYLEPAVVSLGVVGTLLLLFFATPLGRFLSALNESGLYRAALIVAVLSAVGGVGGALLGASSSGARPVHDRFSTWISVAALISCGALSAALILAMVLAAGRQADSPEQMTRIMLGIVGGAAFIAGLVTQTVAPRRLLLPAPLGFGVACGVFLGVAAASGAEGGALVGMAMLAAIGVAFAVVGTAIGWVLRKRRVRGAVDGG